MKTWRSFAAAAAVALASPLAAAELVMVEKAGCPWCALWDEEIAPIYPKSAEGQIAPLRRVELGGPYPDELSFDAPLRVTPTFVLVEDGEEIARLEGYPGEDFFWAMLERMLTELEETE